MKTSHGNYNSCLLLIHRCELHHQSRISRTTYPQLGGTLSQGAQNSVLSPLSLPEKASISKLQYQALDINEVRGPFERKVLMHYSYFEPLSKQGIYTLQLLLAAV